MLGRWLLWALAIITVMWTAYDVLFSEHGYRVYHQEKLQLQQLRQQLEDLQLQQQRLAKQILKLRHDPKALEELVHRELGYVYPDELMMIMPEKQSQQGKPDAARKSE